MNAAAELRRASTASGRRMLEEVAPHSDDGLIGAFLAEVRADTSPGTHSVVLGVVASAFGASPVVAAATVLQGTTNVILQAAMRLLPVSHRDVQAMLLRLRPTIAVLAVAASAAGRPLEAFHPLQDIAAMRHEAANVRMLSSSTSSRGTSTARETSRTMRR